jgi:CelD/BcsL family acetyltransferase involved in cellulose biosynthesis
MDNALGRARPRLRWSAARPATAHRADYAVEVLTDWRAWPSLLAELQPSSATLFQSASWLECWYRTVGASQATEPLLIRIAERRSGLAVAALPLIRIRSRGLRIVEFADLGVTDYNAPVLGARAPATPEAAQALWRSIAKSLSDTDLVRLRKMPASVGGRSNPLTLLGSTHPSSSESFSVTLPDDWEAYLRSLAKKFRKELGRSLRLFEKSGGTSFRQIDGRDDARRILASMDIQQNVRLGQMGSRTPLDAQHYQAFYEHLVEEGIERGTTLLMALEAGEETVAALLGIADGETFSMLRLSHQTGGDWSKIGLGRAIIERSMHLLHARGMRRFDFGIGDYPYKAGFGVAGQPLFDFVAALTWRGLRHGSAEIVKAQVKRGLDAAGLRFVPKAVKARYHRYHAGKTGPSAQEP